MSKNASWLAAPSLSIVYYNDSAFTTTKPDPTHSVVAVLRHAQGIVWFHSFYIRITV